MARDYDFHDVSELPDEYLLCRKRHIYQIVDYDGLAPSHWKNGRTTAIMQEECDNCTSKKYSYIVRKTGEYISKPVVRQPRNYRLPKGAGTMWNVRKEIAFRFLPVSTNGKE